MRSTGECRARATIDPCHSARTAVGTADPTRPGEYEPTDGRNREPIGSWGRLFQTGSVWRRFGVRTEYYVHTQSIIHPFADIAQWADRNQTP